MKKNLAHILLTPSDCYVEQQGTHDELVAMKGEYAKMWHAQSRKEAEEAGEDIASESKSETEEL